MRNTILIGLVCLIFLGCKKDSYSSTPQLTYKSTNTTDLLKDQILKINLTVTDAEGDIIDTIYIQRVSLKCAINNFKDSIQIPDFPTSKNLKSNILISYANGINSSPPYTTIASQCAEADSCYFNFWMKDKANHKSDTVRSDIIIIEK